MMQALNRARPRLQGHCAEAPPGGCRRVDCGPAESRETIEIVPSTPQFNHSTQAQPVCVKPASRQVAADNSPS